MADVIQTEYMDKPIRGIKEYICKDAAAMSAILPHPGDRAIVLDEGKVYFCVDEANPEWLPFGGDN